MKTIFLMRHAKSSNSSGLKDEDRPLTKKGKEDALRMGMYVKQINALPTYILSSSAKRARQTVQYFAKAADLNSELIKLNGELYYGGARDYLAVIQKAPTDSANILLTGHNPLLEETIALLCDNEGAYVVRMSTSALVCIEHPAIEWKQIRPGTARIKWMITPELMKKMSS